MTSWPHKQELDVSAYPLPQKHVYFSINLNSLLFKKVLLDLSLCCSWLLLSSLQLVASTGRHPASHLESLERGAQGGAKMKWLRETENRIENEYLRQESLSTGALVTAEAKTSATWERKKYTRVISSNNWGGKPRYFEIHQDLHQRKPGKYWNHFWCNGIVAKKRVRQIASTPLCIAFHCK